MPRMKTMLLSLSAAMVLGASMATPAFASPEWWVEGKPLSGAEELAASPTVTKTLVFSNGALKVECSKVKLVGGLIQQTGKKNILKSLEFESCGVAGNANCVVVSFRTEALEFPLEGEKEKIKLNFRPSSGSTVAKIVIEKTGGACSAEGVHELASGPKSGMVCNYPSVETESLEHELQFAEGSGSELSLDGKAATFTGVFKFSLASKKKWSAR